MSVFSKNFRIFLLCAATFPPTLSRETKLVEINFSNPPNCLVKVSTCSVPKVPVASDVVGVGIGFGLGFALIALGFP